MGAVFGSVTPPASLKNALEALERGACKCMKAFAENLRQDARVGTDRAERCIAHMAPYLDAEPATADLPAALNDYRERRICNRRGLVTGFTPDYAEPWNAHNRLSRDSSGLPKIPDTTLLASVIWLSYLERDIELAAAPGLPAPWQPRKFRDWLDDISTPAWSAEQRKERVGVLMEGLDRHGAKYSRAPMWATYWERMAPLLAGEPIHWLEALGMAKAPQKQWIAVLVYPVRDAGTLYRPTQLEAGANGYHYPTAAASQVGRTMHLDRSTTETPCPEVIHAWPPRPGFAAEAWARSCRLAGAAPVGIADRHTPGEAKAAGRVLRCEEIQVQRTAHSKRLGGLP